MSRKMNCRELAALSPVPTDEEDNSRMLIDYASAGKEWGTVIAAWIPTDKEG